MTIITLLSALFISSVAAWFSIAGLIAIFPGAPVAVGVMGSALEVGKLVAASWIYRFWKKTNFLMKTYFIVAVAVLSFITSIGIFGYLTRAYVEGTEGLDANSEQIYLLDEQIQVERDNITGARLTLEQLDAAVNRLITDSLRVERGVQIRNAQRNERTALATAIAESNARISELQKEKSELNVGQRKLETEIGPIKYVAQLVYGDDESDTIDRAVRLLVLLLIFVFDPLAILLVIAANISFRKDPPVVVVPPTKNLAESLNNKENTTKMDTEWNPGSWFKMVNKPK
jgi:hypothetical protein